LVLRPFVLSVVAEASTSSASCGTACSVPTSPATRWPNGRSLWPFWAVRAQSGSSRPCRRSDWAGLGICALRLGSPERTRWKGIDRCPFDSRCAARRSTTPTRQAGKRSHTVMACRCGSIPGTWNRRCLPMPGYQDRHP
jgi:hypothetical protein